MTGAPEAATSMVARVALIMNAFDTVGGPLRLDQVVAHTGLPRSSVHRILTQLHEAGLLAHRADGYVRAGVAKPASSDHADLRGLAAPVLERLHCDTALVVHLGVLVDADVLYLDKIAGVGGQGVPTRVTGRTPAHASALGKSMLSQLSAEQVDAIHPDPLGKYTPSTIADLPTLHQELLRIRSRHGLAYDDQELVVGLSSIAAPIRLADGQLAGLSLTGAVPVHQLHRMAPFLSRAARGIADRIGSPATTSDDPVPISFTDDMLSRILRTLSSDDWL